MGTTPVIPDQLAARAFRITQLLDEFSKTVLTAVFSVADLLEEQSAFCDASLERGREATRIADKAAVAGSGRGTENGP